MRSVLHWLGLSRHGHEPESLPLRFTGEKPVPIPPAPGVDAGPGFPAAAMEMTPWTIARLGVIAKEVVERPSSAALAAARAARSCLVRFWLAAPVDGLETLFAGPIGDVYRQFLEGALPALPLDAAEQAWKEKLTEVLQQGFDRQGSVNTLLALLLFLDREVMQVHDPLTHLPSWLLPLYASRCEPGLGSEPGREPTRAPAQLPPAAPFAPALPDLAPITGAACMALIGDADFLGRLSGLIHLYGMDPTDPEICRDLSMGRRQVAQVWLDVETEQLETLYRTPFGQLTDNLVASGFAREGLTQDERDLRQQLTEVAADLRHPRALNALIAALLYFPIEQVTLPADPALLPPWLERSLSKLGARPAA